MVDSPLISRKGFNRIANTINNFDRNHFEHDGSDYDDGEEREEYEEGDVAENMWGDTFTYSGGEWFKNRNDDDYYTYSDYWSDEEPEPQKEGDTCVGQCEGHDEGKCEGHCKVQGDECGEEYDGYYSDHVEEYSDDDDFYCSRFEGSSLERYEEEEAREMKWREQAHNNRCKKSVSFFSCEKCNPTDEQLFERFLKEHKRDCNKWTPFHECYCYGSYRIACHEHHCYPLKEENIKKEKKKKDFGLFHED
ncbi:hypothetical protein YASMINEVIRUS_1556 [Yasminevirus sp. GU-2018]|uniref:Uncharacterized protein n=1 Tax=Yasminevirus sp. GU-2018 TaxID=2420051 RepID=A0A5K0UBS0_9VIRU|nr:hypothetical protein YASMINEVIRUS_1556 [Yasminevirus sp. GU-2018]